MDRVFQLADQLDDVNLKVLADLETSTMAGNGIISKVIQTI